MRSYSPAPARDGPPTPTTRLRPRKPACARASPHAPRHERAHRNYTQRSTGQRNEKTPLGQSNEKLNTTIANQPQVT